MDLVGIRGSRYTLQPFAAGKRPSVHQCSLVVKKEHALSLAVCMTRHCLQACVTVPIAGHPGIPIVKFSNERARCKWSGIHVIRPQLGLVGHLLADSTLYPVSPGFLGQVPYVSTPFVKPRSKTEKPLSRRRDGGQPISSDLRIPSLNRYLRLASRPEMYSTSPTKGVFVLARFESRCG